MGVSFVLSALSKNRAGGAEQPEHAQLRGTSSTAARDGSGSRRREPDADGKPSSRFAALRAAQVRAVGSAFLRARPLVVAPVAAINAALVSASGAPLAQRATLGTAIGLALSLFVVERWWMARATVGERWLAASLTATVVMLAAGCALSGGIASPLLPLVLAPVVVGAAAFGRSRRTIALSVFAFVLVAALALLPAGMPFPAFAPPWSRAMLVCSFAGLLGLAYAGVAGLVGAYVKAGEMLETMRLATIDEAANRMRATEQVGAKLAHELKNPLAAIKTLLQTLTDRLDERGAKRVQVAVAEVDRMDGIIRDYLAFARPLADLELADVELRELADRVIDVLADRAATAGVELIVTGGPVALRGDARRLREAVFNLTDNAITATPRGGSVTLAIGRDPANGAVIAIADTGSGMPAELVDAPAYTTTREDGTGLGLPIARGAITQHGGQLRFTPRPGGGTIATITLPEQL